MNQIETCNFFKLGNQNIQTQSWQMRATVSASSIASQTLRCVESVCRKQNLDLTNSGLIRANKDGFEHFQILSSATENVR